MCCLNYYIIGGGGSELAGLCCHLLVTLGILNKGQSGSMVIKQLDISESGI